MDYTPKYNLNALRDREVTSTITAFLNGRASEEEVAAQLDKIFIHTNVTVDPPASYGDREDGGQTTTSIQDEFERAIVGKKDDLIAFAEKHDIDLSQATNNEDRIDSIKNWYSNIEGGNDEEE